MKIGRFVITYSPRKEPNYLRTFYKNTKGRPFFYFCRLNYFNTGTLSGDFHLAIGPFNFMYWGHV